MTYRTKSNLRESDERAEHAVGKFLDKTFYKEPFISNFNRNMGNKSSQVRGVDVEFDYNGRHLLSDEKTTAQYRDIQTFTLELSFIDRSNNVAEGWLTRDDELNDVFTLVWLNNESVEVCLVERSAIMDYLEGLGWTRERLREKARRIRFENDRNFGDHYTNGCKFFFTERLVEQPINIQLKKDVYKKLALVYKKYDTIEFKKD